ncbi:MAG: RNA-directed DNA polymerase [Deltaproteobacteria bacterium]|nr:RNA-directed DNA polymerase [Deltaproteobacteria bacterium]
MKQLIECSNKEAREHFLKRSSYFTSDLPDYISFEPILKDVADVLKDKSYNEFKNEKDPNKFDKVSYNLVTNKDGKFAWRSLELMHPAIYVSLVNQVCEENNWASIGKRLKEFEEGVVDCCSAPVVSTDHQQDVATTIRNWWERVEQRSLTYSMEFSHLIHTDVSNCYGSLYTHSIAWALHGMAEAKGKRHTNALLGNSIDDHIRAGRYGQTNGIGQGSALMDFIAEIVLGYVDEQINAELKEPTDIKILRYRDDYRIFANSDERAETVLKVVSDSLRKAGMTLGVSKTFLSKNVVDGSIKPDKMAGINLQDLGKTNAKTIQKQLLRLHSFGQCFPNSGALKRLLSDFDTEISEPSVASSDVVDPSDIDVLVAIVADIGFVSPVTIPVVASLLSRFVSLTSTEKKSQLWEKVLKKMKRVPHNGYLEIWLQRVTISKDLGIKLPFDSAEPICKIVNSEKIDLWENGWIKDGVLKDILQVSNILKSSPEDAPELIQPTEVALFKRNDQHS